MFKNMFNDTNFYLYGIYDLSKTANKIKFNNQIKF